ncbi:MAG: 3-oxoacyl-ACP reductase family protein [Bacteroidota bacterium]|nr:3-oxoacyl-ACP reductase family protein [Bacteroidota bacterium]
MINLKNQVALITGGSRGIGAAAALMFAKAGANVAITYLHDKKSADSVVAKIKKSGRKAIAVKGNVAVFNEAQAMVDIVEKKFGRVDILLNNAGVWTEGSVEYLEEETWDETINVNLKGTFNMCKAVVPVMKNNGYGRIINIASTAGQRGEAHHSHYAASKGGVIAFTKSLGAELIRSGIWVNCVAPGWVITDMTAPVFKDKNYREVLRFTIPRGKIATPDEIAGPILFLASNLADNIVGEILNVNGGSVLCG